MIKCKIKQLFILSAIGLIMIGCSQSNQDEDYIITISSSEIITSIQEPATISVTIENLSENEISWGSGSSTCQLKAFVKINNIDYSIFIHRACTYDYIPWVLDPGHIRTESLNWIGEYSHNSVFDTLDPGTYTLYGAAGDWISDSSIEVEVTD